MGNEAGPEQSAAAYRGRQETERSKHEASKQTPGATAMTVSTGPLEAGELGTGSVPAGLVEERAWRIRSRVLEHTIRNGGGYLSQACSSAEIFASLYSGLMDLGPSEGPLEATTFRATPGEDHSVRWLGADYNGAQSDDKDRFIMSPAHYALVLYAALIESGRLGEAALDGFNQDGSTVEMIGAEHSPGMEATTGSLGQGLAVAVGRVLARRRRGACSRLWVLVSDGELQEGELWESCEVASAYRLDELVVLVDANGSQCDGPVDDVLPIEPIVDRLSAFGWEVRQVDGHNPQALLAAAGRRGEGAPLAVVCRTSPYRGLPSLASRAPKFHYLRLSREEASQARNDLDKARPRPAMPAALFNEPAPRTAP